MSEQKKRVTLPYLEATKKLKAVPLRPPIPLEFNDSRNFAAVKNKVFSLMARPLPPPSLMALPLKKNAASLTDKVCIAGSDLLYTLLKFRIKRLLFNGSSE